MKNKFFFFKIFPDKHFASIEMPQVMIMIIEKRGQKDKKTERQKKR